VFDGQYLKEYDPNRNGVDPSGQPMLAHVACTDDPAAALHFEDAGEAHRTSGRWSISAIRSARTASPIGH
jgi:hypothetical protein